MEELRENRTMWLMYHMLGADEVDVIRVEIILVATRAQQMVNRHRRLRKAKVVCSCRDCISDQAVLERLSTVSG